MKVQEIDQKRVAALKGQTTKMQQAVDALDVNDDKSLAEASDLRSRMKQYERAMTKEKKEWLDPINVLRNKIFGVFRPFEEQVATAIKSVDTKIIDFQNKKEEEARREEIKLQSRIDKGTLRPETALRKMGEIDTPDSMIQGGNGKTVIQERRDVEIVALSAIPRAYLVPDMVAIRQAVLLENRKIAGVRIITRKVLASR